MLFSVRPPAGATVRGGAFLCLSLVGISPADVVLSRDRESSDAELTVDSDHLHLVSAGFAQFRPEPFCPRDAEAPGALQCVLSQPPLTSLCG